MLKKPGLYLLFIVLFASALSIKLLAPPPVVSETAADSVFSAKRAFPYLLQVARSPHSTGTEENKKVRDYIAGICKSFGLATHVQNTTAVRKRGNTVQAANVYNVIARLKGRNTGKCVLVMCHFDSALNTPGAGDDGTAVAAMLETARILTSTNTTLRNDIIFLFTDGEELGLLGAQGFLQDTSLSKEVGVVLNFEARGNAGSSIMFETNPQNGWVVREFINATDHPIANSLSYEIYRLLPNDTDYSLFKASGFTGLNHGFIEGFVHYHSPTDKPESLNLRSLQHHGANMLGLVKHFGNIPLTNTKAADISYFNMFARWMIVYPASLNIYGVILCCVLFVLYLLTGLTRKMIRIKGLLVGLLAFLVVLSSVYFGSHLLIKVVQGAYPLNNRFYASNAYNSSYYFYALTALTVSIFTFLYQWVLRRFQVSSILAGILLIETILLILMYSAMPTAIYILLFPLIVFILGQTALLHWRIDEDSEPGIWAAITLISLLPATLLLSPVIRLMFVTFGLDYATPAVALAAGLFLGLVLPVLGPVLKNTRHLVPLGTLASFGIALLLAHFSSSFTKEMPLQTNVRYELNADENQAYWVSDFIENDEWSRQFFNDSLEEETRFTLQGVSSPGGLTGKAPLLAIPSPLASLIKDTIENNRRKLLVRFQSQRESIFMRVAIGADNPATNIEVNGTAASNLKHKRVKDQGQYTELTYTGLNQDGFEASFETTPELPFHITLTDGSVGLPALKGYPEYRADVVPGVGWNSNTTQVRKRFVF